MTEPEDRLVGNGQAAEANFPTPPTRAAVPDWYPELLDAVADCVRTGRQRAVSAANQELVSTYWAMGAEILARQDAEGWDTRVIDRLSADLRERFPAHLRILATQPQVHAGLRRGVARLRNRATLRCTIALASQRCPFGQARYC
jgi:hypothetical protein